MWFIYLLLSKTKPKYAGTDRIWRCCFRSSLPAKQSSPTPCSSALNEPTRRRKSWATSQNRSPRLRLPFKRRQVVFIVFFWTHFLNKSDLLPLMNCDIVAQDDATLNLATFALVDCQLVSRIRHFVQLQCQSRRGFILPEAVRSCLFLIHPFVHSLLDMFFPLFIATILIIYF